MADHPTRSSEVETVQHEKQVEQTYIDIIRQCLVGFKRAIVRKIVLI